MMMTGGGGLAFRWDCGGIVAGCCCSCRTVAGLRWPYCCVRSGDGPQLSRRWSTTSSQIRRALARQPMIPYGCYRSANCCYRCCRPHSKSPCSLARSFGGLSLARLECGALWPSAEGNCLPLRLPLHKAEARAGSRVPFWPSHSRFAGGFGLRQQTACSRTSLSLARARLSATVSAPPVGIDTGDKPKGAVGKSKSPQPSPRSPAHSAHNNLTSNVALFFRVPQQPLDRTVHTFACTPPAPTGRRPQTLGFCSKRPGIRGTRKTE